MTDRHWRFVHWGSDVGGSDVGGSDIGGSAPNIGMLGFLDVGNWTL